MANAKRCWSVNLYARWGEAMVNRRRRQRGGPSHRYLYARCAFNALVLDELDKLKRGTESINAKTRLSIRYLDGKTKIRSRLNRNTTTSDEPSGTLRIQTSEELFSSWEECEKLMKVTAPEDHERKVIPRHLRGMINCAVFQRSHGIESTIVTDDSDLVSFAKRWGIMTMTGNDLDAMSSRSLENYRNELEAYEARGHNAARHSLPQRRALWAPPKK